METETATQTIGLGLSLLALFLFSGCANVRTYAKTTIRPALSNMIEYERARPRLEPDGQGGFYAINMEKR